MTKLSLTLLVAAALVFSAAGCARPTATTEPVEEPAVEEPTLAPVEEPTATLEGEEAMMGPGVEVEDQAVVDGTVTVASVTSDGPGWIVIHVDDAGAPGAAIGYVQVSDGENTDVSVTLDEEPAAGDVLWAMLHVDGGVEGTYEGEGDPDGPAMDADGAVVQSSFEISE
jgi:hypothetical protein